MFRLQANEEIGINDKYKELLEYLEQDDKYWIKNDKWDFTEKSFYGELVLESRYIDFSKFKNEVIKNEIKYYVLKMIKEDFDRVSILNKSYRLKNIGKFLEKEYSKKRSIYSILNKTEMIFKWNEYLQNNTKIKQNSSIKVCNIVLNEIYDFIHEYYDDLEEFEKDIWKINNIKGARLPASIKSAILDFIDLPQYYRQDIKRYFSTIITKKSWCTCNEYLTVLKYFFKLFYKKGYKDGFLEEITRQDIEKYLFWLSNDFNDKNATYKSKFITYLRTTLEYMQIAEYETAPKKDINRLIYRDDIPRRETNTDVINRVKYIPTPIIEQIDNNINDIDNKEIVAMYKLLRETGWRGTDILNLRYDNCLERIWKENENKYAFYLCGEITKTGIAELKVPIHEEIAQMLEECIEKAKLQSTDNNNPNKYVFNTFTGKNKGRPIGRVKITQEVQKLIENKNILDAQGNIYHFRLHSLRHTRALEYTEQELGISVVQQMLGHRSLQMTVHYATVSEDILYEKWKETEKLQLFKLNISTQKLEKIDAKENDKLVRFEYIKKNLEAVRVPFGICFKSQKIECKNQITHCLTCSNFCTTTENLSEYEEEIKRVKNQIEISERLGRTTWIEKNMEYLKLLEEFVKRIKEEKIIHKNGNSREEC